MQKRKKWRGKKKKKNKNKVERDRRGKRRKKEKADDGYGLELAPHFGLSFHPRAAVQSMQNLIIMAHRVSACLFLAEINHFLVLFLVQIMAEVPDVFFMSRQQECKQRLNLYLAGSIFSSTILKLNS